jgi:hypothetical protein
MTAEEIMEVLRSLRSDGLLDHRAVGTMRRRTLPRVGVRTRMSILRVNDSLEHRSGHAKPEVVRVRNIGPRGIGVIGQHAMASGERFLVLLPRERGGVIRLLAEVRRCSTFGDGSFDIGAAFLLDATNEEIEDCIRTIKRAA